MSLLVAILHTYNSSLEQYPFYIQLNIRIDKNCIAFGKEDHFT